MNTQIARNKSILKQRLNRFLFNHHNVGRKQVADIALQLGELGETHLFGGAIRDIALQGITYFYADLDFVVHTQPQKLAQFMAQLSQKHTVSQNKFGGYRILCDKWWLDIWPRQSTWAFTHKHVPYHSVESLLHTTILNWDAALYCINTRKILVNPDYFEQLNSQIADLNLARNPNPKGAFVRVLRCLASKPVKHITPKLQAYIIDNLSNYSLIECQQYELTHYTQLYLNQVTPEEISQLASKLTSSGLTTKSTLNTTLNTLANSPTSSANDLHNGMNTTIKNPLYRANLELLDVLTTVTTQQNTKTSTKPNAKPNSQSERT